MFPFAILDPNVNVNEFLSACVIPFFKELENGNFKCDFALDNLETTFCGGLNFVLGMEG